MKGAAKMIIRTIEQKDEEMKTAKILQIGASNIVQFIDHRNRHRSATAFCPDLAIAQKTYALIVEREFAPAVTHIAVAFA